MPAEYSWKFKTKFRLA